MMHLCISSLPITETNKNLETAITDFYIDVSEHGEEDVKLASKRLRALTTHRQNQEFHKVPKYSLNLVNELVGTLHKEFKLYWATNNDIEHKIRDLEAEFRSVTLKFSIFEQSQENYFRLERNILEEIFTFTRQSNEFSFQHR